MSKTEKPLAIECISVKDAEFLFGKMRKMLGQIAFHKTEAIEWRKLYESKRGGKAYAEMQMELIALRYENRQLKQGNK